jgi:hypothetical protein
MLVDLVKKLRNVKRVNVKIDITFWAVLPYSERLDYVINREKYTPISTRFLCFSSTIVYKHDKVETLDIPKESQIKLNNIDNDRTDFNRKRFTSNRPRS